MQIEGKVLLITGASRGIGAACAAEFARAGARLALTARSPVAGSQSYGKTAFQQRARGGPIPPEVVRGRRFAISAADCAATIRRGVERDARTVVIPAAAWLLVCAMRLFLSSMESQLVRMAQV
ncbi:MAG TPA: SDR family NAD(P)-dependent oxidoreductase [Bryobacteraceae bacterium]|nr:SDR family NAD(P)-dependent oxidoreductase [Bryobacteraceae bacterium]